LRAAAPNNMERQYRIILFTCLCIIIMVAAVVALVTRDVTPAGPGDQQDPVPSLNPDTQRNPDPVKKASPDKTDITPSPSGTGPGSNNSLLGP
jgi:hypothetical protein